MKFLGIIFLFLISCSNDVKKGIDGMWSIDTLYFNYYNTKPCLRSNVLIFEKNVVDLPNSSGWCIGLNGADANKGVWNYFYNDSAELFINIVSENKVFAGKHKLLFKKDARHKLIKMEIYSDSLYLVCRKGLFDYDKNTRLINALCKEPN